MYILFFLNLQLIQTGRGLRILNDIKGTGFVIDGQDQDYERFHYLKYLAALFSYTLPVDEECNPTIVVRYTWWGAYW